MKRISLYGLANARGKYSVIGCTYIDEEYFSIKTLIGHAAWLRLQNPTIDHVYAVDDRRGLYADYKAAVRHNTIESNVAFKDMLEREGLLIL